MAQVKQIALRRDPSDKSYVVLREHLVAARKAAGLKQHDLAKMIGKPQSFVAKIERGERYLNVVEFAVISKIIGLDPQQTIAAILHEAGN